MEKEQTVNLIRYGLAEPLPERRKLAAGRLTAVLENGGLRYIRYGNRELVRGIYAAVRDRNWGTVVPVFRRYEVRQEAESFAVDFEAEHRNDEVHFVWEGRIRGTAEGTIRFEMDGAARREFLRNRIGFCVLHPAEQAGLPLEVETPDKTVTGRFPTAISPHQPFVDMRAMRIRLEPGLEVSIGFEGDLFEMEDQRNWIDASYKTYCTPLRLPFPVRISAGSRVKQSVELTVHAADELEFADERAEVETDDAKSGRLAELGTVAAGERWSDAILQAIGSLPISYFRCVVRLPEHAASWRERISLAAEQAARVGAALELELMLPDGDRETLESVVAFLADRKPDVRRIFAFSSATYLTTSDPSSALETLRETYGLDFEIGGGTCANFTELNRSDLPLHTFDCITYSMNPQVHAFDLVSIAETLSAMPATVQTIKERCGGKPLRLGPVTLKPRFNPNATSAEALALSFERDRQRDARLHSLFGAGWTIGAWARLSLHGVSSVSFYEDVGPLGWIRHDHDRGQPLYRTMALFGGTIAQLGAPVELRGMKGYDPLALTVFRAIGPNGGVLVAVNHTDLAQTVRFKPGLSLRPEWMADEVSMSGTDNPGKAVDGSDCLVPSPDGGELLHLRPFAIACLRCNAEKVRD